MRSLNIGIIIILRNDKHLIRESDCCNRLICQVSLQQFLPCCIDHFNCQPVSVLLEDHHRAVMDVVTHDPAGIFPLREAVALPRRDVYAPL